MNRVEKREDRRAKGGEGRARKGRKIKEGKRGRKLKRGNKEKEEVGNLKGKR